MGKSFFLTAILSTLLYGQTGADLQIKSIHPLDNMPLVQNPQVNYQGGLAPVEERGPEYRKWLAASVKIRVSGASGSGTIVYYDRTKNKAYVASCGHLRSGSQSFQEGRGRACKVETWYHNDKKLSESKIYDAEVLFWSNHPGPDTSLIVFTPDWEPNYFPIAPLDHQIPVGKRVHSCGSDGGRESAHYDVEIVGIQGKNLVTEYTSPRPGRSGGGLMDERYYSATCWGTSDYDGSGIGYFTPLSGIHSYWSANGHSWLLNISPSGGLAQELPIVDHNNPQGRYPKDYIVVPN